MKIELCLTLIPWVLIIFLTSCDKNDDQPQVYFDANGCEFTVPISGFSQVILSWDGLVQRVDTVSHGISLSSFEEGFYVLFGGTLSSSCNINQLWSMTFNQSAVSIDTLEICHLENSCITRYLEDEEIFFSFEIKNFDETLAYYTPIEHPSNFFYIEQKGDEGSDMIFSYKVHLKQNGSSAAADIYPDTLIMETTDAIAFYSIL